MLSVGLTISDWLIVFCVYIFEVLSFFDEILAYFLQEWHRSQTPSFLPVFYETLIQISSCKKRTLRFRNARLPSSNPIFGRFCPLINTRYFFGSDFFINRI